MGYESNTSIKRVLYSSKLSTILFLPDMPTQDDDESEGKFVGLLSAPALIQMLFVVDI